MFWAIVIGFVGMAMLGIGVNMWTGYEQPPKKGDAPKPLVIKTQEHRESEKKIGAVMTLVGLLILSGVFGWYKLYYQSNAQVKSRQNLEAAKACEDRTMAYVMSQNFVKRTLKAPSSASFPTITKIKSVAVGDCKFNILAYVDAQNGFGAQIRTHYTATMEYLPQSKTWRALDLNIIQ